MTVECEEAEENAWINEFHYDNTGGDVGEFIEIAANFNAGDSSEGYYYSIWLYNGSNGEYYENVKLDDLTKTVTDGIYYYVWNINGIQNGPPDGIALNGNNGIVEFISYEGSFTATDGPANGMTSTDIGVTESSSTPVGHSLQLTDAGWVAPQANTKGAINTNQTLESGSGGFPDSAQTFEEWLAANGNNTATDSCSEVTWSNDYSVTPILVPEPDPCAPFSATVTFFVTDECGNDNETTSTYELNPQDPVGVSNDNDEDSMSLAGSNEGEAMGVELDFMAYPVPFDRDINVKFNFEFDTDVVIDIHDTRGLLVKSVTLNNVRANSDVKKSFDLSRAGDQLFYITVTTNRGSVTKKAVSSNMKRR